MSATEKIWLDDNAPQCQAVDLNGFKNENNNLILSSNQALSTADNAQTSKAVSTYASKGDFYEEDATSAADVYVLTPSDSLVSIFELKDGMRLRFEVANQNTGASTLTVLGVAGTFPIEESGLAINPGLLTTGDVFEVVFDETNSVFNLNSFKKENNNLITSSGQTLNTADPTQTAKAVSTYASKGDFYKEEATSAANIYVLEPSDNLDSIVELKDGIRLRFRVVNQNTGASTLTVLGVAGPFPIEQNGSALNSGVLTTDNVFEVIFDETNSVFDLINVAQKSGASAFIRFNGSVTPTVVHSFNVSSLVRISNGLYDINFTNNISSSSPIVLLQNDFNTTNLKSFSVGNLSNSSIRIGTYDNNGTIDDLPGINVGIFS